MHSALPPLSALRDIVGIALVMIGLAIHKLAASRADAGGLET